ncbi:MAG: ribbon-helix-helix domain-containing protein [archaeon]
METVSLKLEDGLAARIRKAQAEFNYSTKTEFIREAIRQRLGQLEEERKKERAWKALFAARGIFKGKGKAKTDEEWHKWRMENGEKLAKELAEKYGWKI